MYTVKGKLEVLNANADHVFQSSLSKLSPACEDAIGGELEFVATISSYCIEPKLLRFAHQALKHDILTTIRGRLNWRENGGVAKTSKKNLF